MLGWVMGFWMSHAQIYPSQSLFSYNTMYVNPANTGILGKGSVFVWNRLQWMGFDGAPNTTMISFEYPLQKTAFGANLYYDYAGFVNQWHASGYFSYLLNLNKFTFLSMGLNLGAEQIRLDPSKLNVKDPGEAYFDETTSAMDIVAGVGFTVFTDTWYVGLSSPNVIPYRGLSSTDKAKASVPQIYMAGGVNWELSYTVIFRPSLFLYYGQDVPFGFDMTANFLFHDKFSAGLGYRLNSAYILLLGYKFSDVFSVGYSFDWDASELHKYNNGSHELFLRFEFDTKTERVRFQSPRFF